MRSTCRNVLVIAAAMFLAIGSAAAATKEPEVANRGLIVAVANGAPAEIKSAANSLKSDANQQPLLKAMAAGHEIQVVDSDALLNGPIADRAFNHVIVVGLPSDPLITAAWQREAAMEDGGIFVFGFGHFKGTLGYIESDRNPFLHSAAVARAPYETELVTITGTTPQAVALAAKAFVERDIVNGLIADGGGWSRPATSLLDRDPITPTVALPAVPATMSGAPMIGVTQASGDEFRNVLADAQVEPMAIYRFKYLPAGAWDTGGVESAIADYKAGLHRRAFADTLWTGVFANDSAADDAAGKIAEAAGLKKSHDGWSGGGKFDEGAPTSVWANGNTVYMTDLKR